MDEGVNEDLRLKASRGMHQHVSKTAFAQFRTYYRVYHRILRLADKIELLMGKWNNERNNRRSENQIRGVVGIFG